MPKGDKKPEFEVRVKRTEHYHAVTRIPADSEEAARQEIQQMLDHGGWDSVFPAEEGDYDECWSAVEHVERLEPEPIDD